MNEYYRYLLYTTWPAMVMLFFLCAYVIFRIIRCWNKKTVYPRDFLDYLSAGGKTLVWIAIGLSYAAMFYQSHGDWFVRPQVIQGEVQATEQVQGDEKFLLEVGDGSRLIVLSIDKPTYQAVYTGDKVRIIYLPVRKVAVTCQVIAR